jgi:hypothetical protein
MTILFYLSPAPHALPHAAGFSSGLSEAPHAAGFSSGLSVAPHAVPHPEAGVCSAILLHPNKFESAILFSFLRCILRITSLIS